MNLFEVVCVTTVAAIGGVVGWKVGGTIGGEAGSVIGAIVGCVAAPVGLSLVSLKNKSRSDFDQQRASSSLTMGSDVGETNQSRLVDDRSQQMLQFTEERK